MSAIELDNQADNYVNDEIIERDWAMKAYQHAEVHFNLLCAIGDCTNLRLTPHDEKVYEAFQERFADLSLDVVSDDVLKSPVAKAEWRSFCEQFKDVVEDYNFGTLLRLDCRADYSESNTTLVPRIQFLAIEIVRNKRGLNNGLRDRYPTNTIE